MHDEMQGIPVSIRAQVAMLVHDLRAILGDTIVVVIHGSVALGDYQPGRSDLDVLVFCAAAPNPPQHMALASLMVRLSGQPAPIEISVLDMALLGAWVHPAPFYFHYSEDWREATNAALADVAHVWVHQRTDPDLSAHMVIAHHHGVLVHGHADLPIPTPQQALAAVWYDIMAAETQIIRDPDYVILNLCRTIRWLEHGEVHSKGSGGVAMLTELTGTAHMVVSKMVAKRNGAPIDLLDDEIMQQVARQLLSRIRALLPAI